MGILLRAQVGLCVFGLALASACSGGGNTTTNTTKIVEPPPRMANPDQVRAELKPVLDAECGWLFKCCSDGERAQTLGPATSSDCADHLLESATVSYAYGLAGAPISQTLLQVLNSLQFDFDKAAVTVDSAAITACAAQLSANDCNPAPPTDHCVPKAIVSIADDPCQLDKLLIGSLALGADCTAYGANQCAPGLFCRPVADASGVCIAKPVVGDLCLNDQDCPALVCDWATGKCAAGADYDADCSFSDPAHPVPGTEAVRCRSGLVCDTVTLRCADPDCAAGINCGKDRDCPSGVGCVMNNCGPLKGDGEVCYQGTDCEHGTCSYDPLAGHSTCVAPKAVGAPCQQASDCASFFCEYEQGGLSATCTATLADGEPCLTGQGEVCDSGKCDVGSGQCVAVKAGDACASDSECAPNAPHGLFCVGGVCAKAPFANGKPCVSNAQCSSAACVAQKCVAKGKVGAVCGAATSAPCDDDEYCNVLAGKTAGKCAAKKAQGELCATDLECESGCQASRGELRCSGQIPGTASCGG